MKNTQKRVIILVLKSEKIAETLEAPLNSANFGWISEGNTKEEKFLC